MRGKELRRRLEAYAASYLPQWRYQREGGEPESALLTALGLMLEESRKDLDRLPKRMEDEFLSGFALDERGEGTARAYACFTAPEETMVPAGSEFYLGGDGGRVWQVERDVWASPMRLTGHLLCGGGDGKLIPLALPRGEKGVKLFDFSAPGSQRRAVRFSHPDAFASRKGCQVRLTLARASQELLAFLTGSQAHWSMGGGTGRQGLDAPGVEDGALSFTLPAMADAGWLLAEAAGVPPEGPAGEIRVSAARPGFSGGEGLSCDAALTDEGTVEEGTFLPFGADVAVWKVCQFACEDALGLRGARVTAAWTMVMEEREELLPGLDQEVEYKPVMRRLPPDPPEVRDVWADGVAWEYWNGGGWRSIPGTGEYAGCFGPPDRGAVALSASFTWPEDARRCQEQGVEAYWLRWRVRTAEGAGWLPRRSHAPAVSDVRFTAWLADGAVSVERACGLSDAPFLSVRPLEDLFPPLTGERDEWWLCFDRPPRGGALELYLTFSGSARGAEVTAWERTAEGGVRQLTVEDGTGGLSHSGTLSLTDVRGQFSVRFGQKGWWMCLRDEGGSFRAEERLPVLTGLSCGAARIRAGHDGTCERGDELRPMRGGVVTGSVLTGSFGGGESESGWERRVRARAARHHLGRGVSQTDLDELLRGTVAGVARAGCARRGEVMEVAVLMFDVDHHADAFALQEEEIREVIMARTVLPTLGLEIRLREPRFYPLHVSLWAAPGPGEDFQQVRRAMLDALEQFLHPARGSFHRRGWRLGSLPSLIQLRSCLQDAAPRTALVELRAMVTTPEGGELEVDAVADPFALPVNGPHNILEWEGGTM